MPQAGSAPGALEQLKKVVAKAREEQEARKKGKAPSRTEGGNTKLLAHLWSLIAEEIPQDPGSGRYRQGRTLGKEHKHWYRGKTGNGRYRLFFRYASDSKTIVYGWVNDEQTLRTYGSSTDAYSVCRQRLAQGKPPDDWDTLLAQCQTEQALADATPFVSERAT